MSAYNWEFDFDPSFPVHLFEYAVPGTRDRLHWHRYYEIGLCAEGGGTFQYATKTYDARPGDVFVTNNYETHVAVTRQRQKYIFLIFLPAFISASGAPGQGLSVQYLETFQYNPLNFDNRIPGETEDAEEIRRLMLEALSAYGEKGEDRQMRVDILVRRILLRLRSVYAKTASAKAQIRISPKLLSAQEYINANYTQPLTVEEVARVCGMYPSYFRHVFKETFQVSFKEYVTQLRVAQAQLALSGAEASVSHIIEELGYTNATQFYHTFRRYTGMTPAEYRKARRRQGAP